MPPQCLNILQLLTLLACMTISSGRAKTKNVGVSSADRECVGRASLSIAADTWPVVSATCRFPASSGLWCQSTHADGDPLWFGVLAGKMDQMIWRSVPLNLGQQSMAACMCSSVHFGWCDNSPPGWGGNSHGCWLPTCYLAYQYRCTTRTVCFMICSELW